MFLASICVEVNNWVQPINYIKPCEKLNDFKILTWLRCQFSIYSDTGSTKKGVI